jgi:hypothetical protein
MSAGIGCLRKAKANAAIPRKQDEGIRQQKPQCGFSAGFVVPRRPAMIEQRERFGELRPPFVSVPAQAAAADHASLLKPFLIIGIDVHLENSQLLRNS